MIKFSTINRTLHEAESRRLFMKTVADYVVSIPDFPEPGIIFRDITSVIQDPDGLELAVDGIAEKLEKYDYDLVVAPEARGFIFGMPVAYKVHKGFIPVRKKGKLPRETVSIEYTLEYGTDILEMHKDAIKPGQKVVIIDDLLATGGTGEAIIQLVEKMGGVVAAVVYVIELAGLKGREKMHGIPVETVVSYEGK